MILIDSKENKDYSFCIVSEEGPASILRLIGILSRKSIDWKDWRLWRNIENNTQDIIISIHTGQPDKILNLFRTIPEITGVHYVESDPESETISEGASRQTGEFTVSTS
ncbi:hypothetical protein [Leptospira adleri]|uniref:ACT domain-containing protein n=1 Tax=Leptospira adleri TaxID=2023186 RepID=A0A2M9YRS1_9LEPT|nr:hypothetical protein [Leptospira adleri]PJZ54235.1 hypothetical protein CH380_06960 [Leptospira adleri]PJZ62395.1 hypothetical protein CH376_08570 [Leptospira adleri]TGM52921.1 hypothetical protein EHQ97_13480 [Leptospira adleri]